MSFEVAALLDLRSPQRLMKPVKTPLRCRGPGGRRVGGDSWVVGRGGGCRLEETLQVFVLELIEPVGGPGFVTVGHLHAPNPTEGRPPMNLFN